MKDHVKDSHRAPLTDDAAGTEDKRNTTAACCRRCCRWPARTALASTDSPGGEHAAAATGVLLRLRCAWSLGRRVKFAPFYLLHRAILHPAA
jgi:hypothetical protein